MNKKGFAALAGATALSLLGAAAANAGGFSRGTADTDILFEQGNFNVRTSVTVVSPERKIVSGASNIGHDYADSYVMPSLAAKFRISDNLSCAGTIANSFGAASSFDAPRAPASGIPFGKLEEKFTVMEYGATCAVGFDLSKGRLSFIAGAYVDDFDYDLSVRHPAFGTGTGTVDLSGTAWGWRAGLAYEIPDIALRGQLLYRSGTKIEASGSTAGALMGPGTAEGQGKLPQSIEAKFQTGIAPGWLAYGSVKWTDWSVNKTLDLTTNVGFNNNNDYYWRDGWTVMGGIGHSFNEKISGTAFLMWDRGTSTGWDLHGDVLTLGTGLIMKDGFGELRLGGGVSRVGSIKETKTTGLYAVGHGWSFSGLAGYSLKW
ncbi:outer membrane protein transport protein [Aquamicrobium defluvii]|uniref:Aromatic hydrocarbon degradation protein n=1 Tax=Aquamicrobium defluvii TaxID=69279 RepID=A0A011USZ5_9HYPH|nr:outer membrane protein transport protein [Aquamicrobium defluvii]EXL08943.1 aromatic hydrocarbon degradation protein [Aquamicrobium defluvii]EZQ16140.1 aromatic hydrocarbon degradation protein [Halopseudomonas bauzanensis]TDR35010.1 long-chain fatty acid transport protein [Aquamicrobium defluvii]